MKKSLILLVLVVLSVSSFAQTIWKDTVVVNIPKDGFVHSLYDTIYNNAPGPDSLILTWSKSSESLLTGWSGVGICDATVGGGTCYPFNDGSPHTLKIPPGSKATIDVQMKALTTAMDGCSYVTVTTNFGPMTFKYCAWPTATKNFDNTNFVTIYPNPATDYVNILINDKRVTSINVVNVIGRRIAKFNVDASKNDDIRVPLDKVADGVYLLQFADASGKVMGVRRVTKQ
jgi:hypothetical protein